MSQVHLPDIHNGDSALARLSSKSVEWYTPAKYICAAREVMGAIDLDPASCEQANQVVQATTFYDISSNGLDKPWPGRVWLNPPYGRTDHSSNQEIWSCRLIAQYEAHITTEAILLVNAATDTAWFQRLWQYPICFVSPRIKFYNPQGLQDGPTHGSIFAYFGENEQKFLEVFSQFGRIVKALDVQLPRVENLDLWEEAS